MRVFKIYMHPVHSGFRVKVESALLFDSVEAVKQWPPADQPNADDYLRWLFMLDTRVQLSVSGLYTSTVLSRDWPSYPPMAYSRPFTTATPTLLRAVRIG